MSYSNYHWCIVPGCRNTSIKTPNKLWIQVPTDAERRKTWLKLAKRDPNKMSEKSLLYFCDDHFDLENDMENYVQYKIMGSVKRIRMKPHCVPSRFDCQSDGKRPSTSDELGSAVVKRQRMSIIRETEKSFLDEDNIKKLISCTEVTDIQTEMDVSHQENKHHKAVQTFQQLEHKAMQVAPVQEHKVTQVCLKAKYRSRQVQAGVKSKDSITSPFKFTISTATSPLKISVESAYKLQPSSSAVQRQLQFFEEKYDSNTSSINTPSIAGSTVDYKPSPYTLSSQSKSTSEDSTQENYKKVDKINLRSTLNNIKNKPKVYIGLQKQLYFLINLIKKHTNISEENILLCLMKIKLNKTFTQLADDFELSISQVSNIFFNKMPMIVKVLAPFIRQFSTETIKINLPIAFRHRYSHVTHIIDCLEIEIQKPSKAIYQALTWSEYKKTNTIKYLISCTPDGLVNFVSAGYAGRISDINLLEDCKFLESLHPGATILADRGFKHLESYMSQKGFVLIRPPSVPAGKKLTKFEVQQTKQIASLRIHVERVIRRLREFSILKMHSAINSNLIGMLDYCMIVACALINLQDSLIK